MLGKHYAKNSVSNRRNCRFGAAICRTLIENGYRVIGTGRRVARLEQLQQELGENFHFLAFDISRSPSNRRCVPFPFRNWQSIDLLVNNAGLGLGLESADKASLDDWMQMIDTNIVLTNWGTNYVFWR